MATTGPRTTVFLTHAAPEDNEFALWLASKLAMAGYRVWIDRRRLHGGDDSWDEIDRVLRTEAIKQVVVFTRNVGKPGVKKELAIGEIMKRRLPDPRFIIPIRNDDISMSDAPPELLRENILDAHPNWHDCLKDLFETLEDAAVPKAVSPDANILKSIVDAREDGRRFVVARAEQALTNWFPITPPEAVRYFRFEGLQDQMKSWLAGCPVPHVSFGRLAGTFADPAGFAFAGPFDLNSPTAYDVPFGDFIGGKNLGPYVEKSSASNDVVNLLRQHFDQLAMARGLRAVEFASKEIGWFFPDHLLPSNKIAFTAQNGHRVRRAMSGKFKGLRWHVCLLARARLWPVLVYRVHMNVVLSEDGITPLPGDKTHSRRRRLTKSWWNDVWRDRLLAAMHHLAAGTSSIVMEAGNEQISIATWPTATELPVSYDATDPALPSEEDDEGNIVTSAALDDQGDEGPEDDDDGNDDEERK
jgi:TIR domain